MLNAATKYLVSVSCNIKREPLGLKPIHFVGEVEQGNNE
jgi:hypothetical protein